MGGRRRRISAARRGSTLRGEIVRDKVIRVVEKYIDAVRRNDPTDLSLHPDVIGVFR